MTHPPPHRKPTPSDRLAEERAKLLWLSWDLMDADQQDQLLLAAEAILDRRRRVTVRAGSTAWPDLADGEPTAATVAIEVGLKCRG